MNEIEEYLKQNFEQVEEDTWKSNKKRIGVSTGDDSTLYVYTDKYSTDIWWRENRGFEKTIFNGKPVRTVNDIEKLFDLLNIETYLKWKD